MPYLVSTVITNAQSVADVANTNFFTANDALLSAQSCFEEVYALYCRGGDDYFLNSYYFTNGDFIPDPGRQYAYTLALPQDFYRLRMLQFSGLNAGNMYQPVTKVSTDQFGNSGIIPHYRPIGQTPPGNKWSSTTTYATGNYIYYVDTGLTTPRSAIYKAAQASTNQVPANNGVVNTTYWTLVASSNNGYLTIYDPQGYPNWCMWYYPIQVPLTSSSDLQAIFPNNIVPEIFVYSMACDIRRKQKLDIALYEKRRTELFDALKLQLIRDDHKAEMIKNEFSQGFAPYI